MSCLVVLVAGGLALVVALVVRHQSTGIVVLDDPGYGFDDPRAVVADNAHVWVANYAGNSVTEIDARTDGMVRTLSGDQLDSPGALADDGKHLWVGNFGGSRLMAEFSVSDGRWIRSIPLGQLGFCSPVPLVVGNRLWVYSGGDAGSCLSSSLVDVFDISNGSLVSRPGDDPGMPAIDGLAAGGRHVWVLANQANRLIEFDAASMRQIRTIPLPNSDGPMARDAGIVTYGTHVWVIPTPQLGPAAEIEVDGNTGRLERNPAGAGVSFSAPVDVVGYGSRWFVVDLADDSVSELDARDGALVRRFDGSSYGFDGWAIALTDGHAWVTGTSRGTGTDSVTEFPVS